MIGPGRLATWAGLVLLGIASSGCVIYTLRTDPGPAHGVPKQFFGVGPGETELAAFRKNGWALADTRDGKQYYVRGGDSDLDVSEAEAQVTDDGQGHLRVEYVRLRFSGTRLATYRALVKSLETKHGPPQVSEERDAFPDFVPDPNSDRPRPERLIVHRWRGGAADLVLVGGLEAPENLAASMEYQILLLPPHIVTTAVVP